MGIGWRPIPGGLTLPLRSVAGISLLLRSLLLDPELLKENPAGSNENLRGLSPWEDSPFFPPNPHENERRESVDRLGGSDAVLLLFMLTGGYLLVFVSLACGCVVCSCGRELKMELERPNIFSPMVLDRLCPRGGG